MVLEKVCAQQVPHARQHGPQPLLLVLGRSAVDAAGSPDDALVGHWESALRRGRSSHAAKKNQPETFFRFQADLLHSSRF